MAWLVVGRECLVAPDRVTAFGKHAGYAGHGAEDLGAFHLGKKLFEAVNGEGVELSGVFHLARKHGRKTFQRPKHGSADVYPRVYVFVDPTWSAIAVAFSLNPMEEVKENLGAHAMRNEDNFFVRCEECDFNMGLEPRKILIALLEVRAR